MSYNLQPAVEAGFFKLLVCITKLCVVLCLSCCWLAPQVIQRPLSLQTSYLFRWPGIDEFQRTGDAGRMTPVVLTGETLNEDFCGNVCATCPQKKLSFAS